MLRAIVFLAGVFTLAASPLYAQSTVGFTDPHDLDALLAYRLPDWGYRTWDGTLDFSGGGHDGDTASNRNQGSLGSSFSLYRESERRIWDLSVSLDGAAGHIFNGNAITSYSQSSLTGSAAFRFDGEQYLGTSEFYLQLQGDAQFRYDEESDSRAPADVYGRDRSWILEPGVGLGRVRDVTAIVRAERISERLMALGRPPLSHEQVLEVARVLATEFGYRVVYDRGDRRFWRDVLDPLLDPSRPLEVYEMEYLEEALLESTGTRYQGQYVEMGVSWRENVLEHASRSYSRAKVVRLEAGWLRNLSLTQQLAVTASVGGEDGDSGNQDFLLYRGFLSAAFLLNVSDRNRLDVVAALEGIYREIGLGGNDEYLQRSFLSHFEVTDRFYVEDRVVIRPYGTLDWSTSSTSYGSSEKPRVNWSYGINVDYYFDRMLY